MRSVRGILIAVGIIAASLGGLAEAVASTKPVTVAVPNRPSAQATAYIIGEIFNTRLNIKTDMQPLGTLGTFVGIDTGSIHVHPQIWLPNLSALVAKYANEKGSLQISGKRVAAKQNICVTKQTADKTGIKALSDLADPTMAAKFDSDQDGRGELWIGERTWPSTKVERIRARSYGYDKTMQLLEMAEDVAMASVDVSIAVDRPFVFYCQRPHHVFGLHDIVVLEEKKHDPTGWVITLPSEDPEWLTKSKANSEWYDSHFHVGFATTLNDDFPEAATLLQNMSFTPDDIVAMSYALEVERVTPADFARRWVSDNAERIKDWMK